MKLFIWEGDGISAAYHDDGTLVVLAETPEQARQIVRAQVAEASRYSIAAAEAFKAFHAKRQKRIDAARHSTVPYTSEENEELARLQEKWPYRRDFWDGSEKALSRHPDRVVELDVPMVVAFNGGGYD